ncbi:MAG: hypothetical protein K6T81_03090 [Alicyclobacillus macrosporangiidus]|uniref:hypothetical protein n=1 Tax=Alicyclobacillus macrosporangiidus TaxID=392015 RepID=UPI0026EC1669|nr:hypothetical protein [Alicyclobacillus macrosporangiidus]MCL6597707.1 hypothetical protein [Alicyclobacillus macrosporangiidus]
MEYHVEFIPANFAGYAMTRNGADAVERVCNDWAEKGYRLHTIVHKIMANTEPGYYLVFEKSEN